MLKDGTWNFSQKLIDFLPLGFFPLYVNCSFPPLQSQGIREDWNFLFPLIIQGVKIVRSDKWFGEPALLGGEFRDLRGWITAPFWNEGTLWSLKLRTTCPRSLLKGLIEGELQSAFSASVISINNTFMPIPHFWLHSSTPHRCTQHLLG